MARQSAQSISGIFRFSDRFRTMRLLHCVLVHLFGTVVEAVLPRQQTPEICKKRPDPGKCEPTYPAWYYDSNNGFCKLFLYSGCGGNSNRFLTEVKCQETCLPGKTPQCLCSLLPRPVRCKTPFRLPWFFNPKTQLCQKYQRGFCAGNTNSFSTCVKCMNRCSIIHAVETCRLIHKKVEEMKQHSGRRPK
uniref:Pancreatic trypsin inhibitor n=1 Tax=Rhipicephalus appendiculatus TaxID=34631 RepID=A0A131YQF9_RHIAP